MCEVWIASRMLCWLVILPVLKRVLPLPSLVSLMWSQPVSPRVSTASENDRMWRIAHWLARHAWPRTSGTCLEQSLILYRFLSALHASPHLVIGVRRHNETMGAHAWVTVDGNPVGDSMVALADFAPVVCFGPGGAPSTSATLTPGLL